MWPQEEQVKVQVNRLAQRERQFFLPCLEQGKAGQPPQLADSAFLVDQGA